MPNYRRSKVAGGTFFFTLVTASRQPILCTPRARSILRECVADARYRRPFTIDAFVLLPDHLHTIWTLPLDDHDFSTRWADIKANFTRKWLNDGGAEQSITIDQKSQGRRGVWQPRFMEHTIVEDDDLFAHFDYLHYNPVKHGYVKRQVDWSWSSFHRYVAEGWYTSDWGCAEPMPSLDRVDTDLLE